MRRALGYKGVTSEGAELNQIFTKIEAYLPSPIGPRKFASTSCFRLEVVIEIGHSCVGVLVTQFFPFAFCRCNHDLQSKLLPNLEMLLVYRCLLALLPSTALQRFAL
ncbi:hypothetical protein Tco_0255307, partial [Tanacetum coccineum]